MFHVFSDHAEYNHHNRRFDERHLLSLLIWKVLFILQKQSQRYSFVFETVTLHFSMPDFLPGINPLLFSTGQTAPASSSFMKMNVECTVSSFPLVQLHLCWVFRYPLGYKNNSKQISLGEEERVKQILKRKCNRYKRQAHQEEFF